MPPKQCPNCGQWGAPNAPFCPQCGASLPLAAVPRSGCGPVLFGSVFGCMGLVALCVLIVGAIIIALLLGLLQNCNTMSH